MKQMKKLLGMLLSVTLALGAAAYLPVPSLYKLEVQAAETYSTKTASNNQTIQGKKGTIKVEHSYKRIVLKGSSDAVKKINAKLKSDSDKFMKSSEAITTAKIICNEQAGADTYKDQVTQTVSFLSDEVISIRTKHEWYAGGVSNTTISGYTFSLSTGKRITKITSVTETSSLEKIVTSLQKKLKADGLDATCLNGMSAKSFSFYMNEAGKVIVCFAPYEVNQGGSTACYTLSGKYEKKAISTQELFDNAVRDAVFADNDEIYPLVTVDKNSDKVVWNTAKDKVLMATWHKYPDSYPSGEKVTNAWGEVWTFSPQEMIDWYQNHKEEMKKNPALRLKQLMGLSESKAYTTVTAFWVDPKDLVRPAYVTDITAQMTNEFSKEDNRTESEMWYTEWFNSNIIWSYFDGSSPWTRLGYTYDWADNGTEYGLSEFLVKSNSNLEVEFTMTTDEFIQWLGKQ